MEKLSIISVKDSNGGYTGFLKDRPNVIAEGDTELQMVKNLVDLAKAVDEHESKQKKEKK